MKPEQQRIAIAEWCGWMWYDGWHHVTDKREEPPDYLNDLNAMHEAESKIELPEAYASRLGPILLRDGVVSNLHGTTMWSFAFAHAAAAQRAEALLRTIGKWEDDK